MGLLRARQNAYIHGGNRLGRSMADWQFWAAAFAITVAVFWRMSRALRAGPVADDNPSLRVYRDQLAEVDRDQARGVITPGEAAQIRVEVSRRVLDADRNHRVTAGNRKATAPFASAVIGVALMAAVGGYYWLGAPGYPDLPLSTRLAQAQTAYDSRPDQAQAESAAPAPVVAEVDAEFMDLMAKLRAAVLARPDDMAGLALLARNEASLGNFVAARTAQQHFLALKGAAATAEDHETLAQLMIAAANGFVSPQAEAELITALQLDPTRGLARYFSGLMFFQTGRPDRTFALWQPLLTEGPENAPWIGPIRAQIEDIAMMAGVKFSLPDAKGPDAAAIAAADDMTPEDRQAMIQGMVGQLQDRLDSEGGPVADWVKLINALAVLGEADRAKAAVDAAQTAFAANPDGLKAIAAAATQAGLTP